jgi:hypothetical protein
MLKAFVSFFNELSTERKTLLVTSVSFFNELATERKNMLMTFVSFFNKISTERKTMLITSFSFFNELATYKRNYARRLFLIMDSKRMMLWKDTMSRDKTRSWIPRDIHWMEEQCSGRNTYRGP